MRYGLVGEPNMIWESKSLAGKDSAPGTPPTWVNYGGDKLWPAPQSLWNWPPDPILDGSSCSVKVEGASVLVFGKNSPKSGVIFKRSITMEPTGTGVKITNSMMNTAQKPQELAVWEITQTDNPDLVFV